jgi:hypothetical protein
MYEVSPRWTQKQSNSLKPPLIVENQQFISQYFNRDNLLIYDEKVMEDIDDLSDTEKVSLISDIELCDDFAEGSNASNFSNNNKAG